jgi:hypothetical protein
VRETVHLRDVRVIEGGERLRFAIEAGEALGVDREVGRQNYQGDIALQLGVAGLVDLDHPAGADWSGDLVRPKTAAGGEAHSNLRA